MNDVCGDEHVGPDEFCDDGNDVDDDDCPNDCQSPTCGNAFIDAGEACDGALLGGETCVSQGFGSGELACGDNCQFDTNGCNACGNGVIDLGEDCDGSELGGASCMSEGAGGGMLGCTNDC